MKNKILLSIIFTFILIVAGYTISNAATYETDTFKINIPDKYKVVKSTNGLEAEYEDSSNAVAIDIESSNNDNKVMADEELLTHMISHFKEQYGVNFTLLSSQVLETNGCKGLEIQFREKESVYYYYADVYTYYSDSKIYSILLVCGNQNYLTSSEKNNIIKSFKVKDTVKTTNGIPFMDVKRGDWYYNSVKYVSDRKIITGTTAYTFNPNGNLTRGQLATIIWRMEGMPKATKGKEFPDVKSGAYYYAAVKWASENKIVNGYADGKFGPNNEVTREQLAVMLNNYAKYKKKNTSQLADISKFKDNKKVSSYAVTAIRWAIQNKIISGKENGTKIAPQGKATRAEAAAMLESYYAYVK